MSNLARTLLAIVVILTIWPTSSAFAQAPDREFTIAIGETLTFSSKGVRNISVGLSKVVKVKTDDRQITVAGMGQGVTTINIFSDRDQKTILIRVVPVNPDALASEVREVLGERSGVDVRVVKGRVLLEGEVASEIFKAKIQKMTELYPNQVLNFTQFREAFVEGARQVALEIHFVKISTANRDRLGIHWGQFLGANYSVGVGDVPLFYANSTPEDLKPNQGVLPGDIGVGGGGGQSRLPNPITITGGNGTSYWSLVGNLNAALDLMESIGVIRSVQRGTLVTETGTDAEYVAGGIINVALPGFGGQSQIGTIPYGIRVKVKPVLDFENRVKLVLDAKSIELDNANGVNGVPATKNNELRGVVNMVEGQSVLIMAQEGYSDSSSNRGIWLLGRIPFLGFLFKGRNRSFQKDNSAFFITPRVYEPGSKYHKTLIQGIFESLLDDGATADDIPELTNAAASKSDADKKKPTKKKQSDPKSDKKK